MDQDLKEQILFEALSPLDEIVSHFYWLKTDENADPFVQHLAPNFEMLLIFNFGPAVPFSFGTEEPGEMLVHQTAVIGPLRKMLNYKLPKNADAIVVNFKLNGFYRLMKIPMNEIGSEGIFDPDILIDKTCFKDLWQQLSQLQLVTERINLMSRYVLDYILDNDSVKPLLDKVSYFHNPTIQPVKAIAADLKLTERAIQLKFRKQTGYSPKELLRFLRFKDVIAEMISGSDKSLNFFELIEKHGYHDQSHMIKDFNHYMNTTPLKFMKEILNKDFCVSYENTNYPD